MERRLATRMQDLQTSDIREILKVAVSSSMISLAGGLPTPEVFPVDELADITREVLELDGPAALQYSTTEGDAELRQAIADRMARVLSIKANADEVLITSGSQQGLDLLGKAFLDKDDAVLCESPTYLGALSAFQAYQPKFVQIPTDDEGMRLEHLAERLADTPRVKLIYVVPDFQNPTGRCWSLERRQGLLDLARRHDAIVVEDCPYAEIRFEGEPIPPLKSLDLDDRVIFLGTFSKIFCPGMRLGWTIARREILEKLVLVKQGADLHTATLTQRQVFRFMTRYGFRAIIEQVRDIYRRRRDVMVQTLDQELPPGTRRTHPCGGLFVWLELPPEIDARIVLKKCLEVDVAFVPGGGFFPNGGHENTIRLNFSAMPEDRIEEGVRRLAAVLRREMEMEPAVAIGAWQ
ncbi:MAG: PLP-dependent aminotransferase family protein [bacterium]|nr:PLP-dependent aminotransferase family protein [bacterium]